MARTPTEIADSDNSLISHLEALRSALLRCVVATALLYPVGYLFSPYLIGFLIKWCFPAGAGALHYFAPMEVFFVQLKIALVTALCAAYPWNVLQIWRFLLPALYDNERKALRLWIIFSSSLFFAGTAFCVFLILPLLMSFSGGFATPELRPLIGLANFLNLAGWLAFAFGLMFQAPIVVMLAVRFGLISAGAVKDKRPYVIIVILVFAAILTPPDVISQLMLAVPTWLLFELGLALARRITPK